MEIFLETKRLIITKPAIEYLDAAFVLDSDPEVMRYMGGARTIQSTREWLEKNIAHQQRNGFGFGFVHEKETNQLIGRAGLLYLAYNESQPDVEIGYRLHKAFWNKGYATELTIALIKWGFKNLPIDKLVAMVKSENTNSRRVLEKSGLHYVRREMYYDSELERHEIFKKDFCSGSM